MTVNNSIVYIVDDDAEIRDAFRWLFESVHIRVKTYDSAQAYLESYDISQRGCLIIDVRMPIMSGLELIEQLNLAESNLSVIMITGHGDVPMAVRAMKAGAVDFILKPINAQYLLDVTQKCLKKNQLDRPEHFAGSYERINSLTSRERQVLDLVIEGKLNKQIAHALNISISTVEVHRARVMKKMGVKTLAELFKTTIHQK